jgi:hypothetical protein
VNVVYDAGALVALDKNDFAMRRYHSRLNEWGVVPIVPAGVLAQAWRGQRQARMSQALKDAHRIDFTRDAARNVGALLAKSKTSDVIDASCVLAAAPVGVIVTSDPDDMRRILTSHPEFAIELHEL